MKRLLLAFAFFSLAIDASANHILGGEITWECAGNGNYIFQLVVYRDCSGLPLSATQESLSWNGPGLIVCTLADSSFISPQCANGLYSINCDSTGSFTPIERYVYRSAPFALPGPIPATGYYFTWAAQARPNTDNTANGPANGYLLRAIMYPYMQSGTPLATTPCYDNAPVFDEKPRYAFGTVANTLYLDGIDPDADDSTHFSWAAPLNYGTPYPGSTIVFDTGYAFNQPLPGSVFNPSNEGPDLFGNGLLYFKSLTAGRFSICYKIESWRNGQRISEVYRDFEMQINTDMGAPGLCAGVQNNPPQISFGWYPNFDTLLPVYENTKLVGYTLDVLAGQAVKFNVLGSDADVNANCTPQQITVTANSPSLSTSLTGGTNCGTSPCATLTSLNANNSYTAAFANSSRFDWQTDTAHANRFTGVGLHSFSFRMTDDNCVLPGEGQIKVSVRVLRPIYANTYSVRICAGDTAQVFIGGDTSNLSWGMAQNISCSNCANPKLFPATTTVYTVTDQNTGYQVAIEVLVDAALAQPQFAQVGDSLVLANASVYDTVFWYRNHGPFFPQPTNSYTPFLSGSYWVGSSGGACAVQSTPIDVWLGNNLAMASGSNGRWFDNRKASLTHGFVFRLNNEPFYAINGIYLHAFAKNQQNNLSALRCRIYTPSLSLVFSTDSVQRISEDVIQFYGEINLSGNTDYFMAIYTDTSLIVPTYKPDVWPVVANQGRVYVYNASNAAGNTIPTNSAPDYPFVHLNLKWGIGLNEDLEANNFEIYPNPVRDVLVLRAEGAIAWRLLSLTGKVTAQSTMHGETTIATELLAAGVYFLEVRFTDGSLKIQKVVVQR